MFFFWVQAMKFLASSCESPWDPETGAVVASQMRRCRRAGSLNFLFLIFFRPLFNFKLKSLKIRAHSLRSTKKKKKTKRLPSLLFLCCGCFLCWNNSWCVDVETDLLCASYCMVRRLCGAEGYSSVAGCVIVDVFGCGNWLRWILVVWLGISLCVLVALRLKWCYVMLLWKLVLSCRFLVFNLRPPYCVWCRFLL